MAESIVLGIVQGVTEWLPISSEGIIVLLKVNFFKGSLTLSNLISYALFLHLGTFLAALIYFRKEVLNLALFKNKRSLKFYIIATLISGIIALGILQILKYVEKELVLGAKGLTLLIGLALLITATVQFKKRAGLKKEENLKILDGVLLGLLQGLAIIPGISRSGITVSGLLLRKFNDSTALKLSFIMSLPVVLAGNIFLNLDKFVFSLENLVGLIFSFLLGIFTIHILLKLSQKINFAWFALIFGLIIIFSALI